jgi:hypothetical protein
MFNEEKVVLASEVMTTSATMPVTVENGLVVCPDTTVPKGAKKVKLDWEMVTPGWEILGVHGLPYPMFTNKAKDGYDYKCKDKNNNAEETDYKYTIIVGSTTTAEVVTLDPTVRNGGIK